MTVCNLQVHVLFSSLAEVNTLSSDDGPLRWVPVIESVIPIVIHKKKVIALLNLNLHFLKAQTIQLLTKY